jgi:hypothetical protein
MIKYNAKNVPDGEYILRSPLCGDRPVVVTTDANGRRVANFTGDDESNCSVELRHMKDVCEFITESKDIKIGFSVSGYVTQTLRVPVSARECDLIAQLESGKLSTSIHEDGTLDITATGEMVGEILDSRDSLEYEDFEFLA